MARWAIETYSKPDETLLDPFCGKGTAPLEGLLSDRHVIGSDLAPDAFVITHAKISGVQHEELKSFLTKLRLPPRMDLSDVPGDVRLFYHPDTLRQILALRYGLFNLLGVEPGHVEDLSGRPLSRRKQVALYALACLLGCLHGPVDWSHNRGGGPADANPESVYLSVHCHHTYSASPSYVRRYITLFGLVPPLRDVIASVQKKSALAQSDSPPKRTGRAICRPAARLNVRTTANLIVTSPPYFRAQTYAWDNWLRLWFLGYEDYRVVARQLLHTESIHRYYHGMRASLNRMARLLTSRGHAVVVVGDVQTRGKGRHPFLRDETRAHRYLWNDPSGRLVVNTSEVIADVASDVGFEVERIVDDLIPRGDRALAASLAPGRGTYVDRAVVLRLKS